MANVMQPRTEARQTEPSRKKAKVTREQRKGFESQGQNLTNLLMIDTGPGNNLQIISIFRRVLFYSAYCCLYMLYLKKIKIKQVGLKLETRTQVSAINHCPFTRAAPNGKWSRPKMGAHQDAHPRLTCESHRSSEFTLAVQPGSVQCSGERST